MFRYFPVNLNLSVKNLIIYSMIILKYIIYYDYNSSRYITYPYLHLGLSILWKAAGFYQIQ